MSSKLLMSATAWGVIAVNILLAVVVSDDILTSSKFLGNFTGVMTLYIPSIDNLAHLSKFPEVTKLVLSVAWLLAIVVFIVYAYVVLKITVPAATIERLRRTRIIMTLITYIFLPAVIWAFISLIGAETPRESGGLPGEMLVRAVGESRFVLGIYSAMLSIGIGFACMFIVYWARLLPILFGKDNHA